MPGQITRSRHDNRTAGNTLATLQQASADHPMIMLGVIVSALCIWMFLPAEQTGLKLRYHSSPPVRSIHDVSTTRKTSRLPARHGDHACEGPAWGSRSLECLTMIARQNGNAAGKDGLIVAAIPVGLDTPDVF
jgi:hypothetical protein